MTRPPHRWVECRVGTTRIQLSTRSPVAVVRAAETTTLTATWSDLDVGSRSVSATILASPTGAWVLYAPDESEPPHPDQGTGAAIHVNPCAEVTRFVRVPSRQAAGATCHGLWLTDATFPDPRDDRAWTCQAVVHVLDVDGTMHALATDRRLALAMNSVDGDAAHLTFYSGKPRAKRDGFGGASYSYEYTRISLPAGHLPTSIAVGDYEAEAIGEHAMFDEMMRLSPHEIDPPVPAPSVAWDLVTLTHDEIRSAVDAVIKEFGDLDSFWHGDAGETHPLSDGLSMPRVVAIGPWPDTRVEVSFTHPHYADGRMRRTLGVFDEAGRVIPPLYASVHLMEDLDTRRLPPASAAQNGILDI
ncbi:hypothetical protein [Microbacterium sp. C7(2022)]|uniref:hypothetical protein n=1 Tax=Microbacterium sp. C7(2022) TaxID=2992759 RepID=UPI00237C3E83|nr:hypothetical protein [Microbacterium sp. C7(2022)]MDE0547096.1 hypothetical protein [Microbacterium sp. C7(2022)]